VAKGPDTVGGSEEEGSSSRDTVYVSEPFASVSAGTSFADSGLTIPAPAPGLRAVYEFGVRLSPAAAHGSPVALDLDTEGLSAVGAISGDSAEVRRTAMVQAASADPVDLLDEATEFGLSSNPVRGQRVVFTFGARPRSVAVYNFVGERVRRFDGGEIEGIEGGPARIVWEPIANDRGSSLSNGVYLLVIETAGGRTDRRRLIVLRGDG
jgi:hypothetical protein